MEKRLSKRNDFQTGLIAKRDFQAELASLPVTQYLVGIPKPNKHCEFGNFDFSEQGQDLGIILTMFLDNILDKKGIFFFGPFGVGKTHLMVALYRVLARRYSGDGKVYFTTFGNLVNDITEDSKNKGSGDSDTFLEYVCKYDYLFIDDITSHKLSEFELGILRTVFINAYENGRSLVLSGNYSIDNLIRVNIEPYLISRLHDICYVFEISGKDRRRKHVRE